MIRIYRLRADTISGATFMERLYLRQQLTPRRRRALFSLMMRIEVLHAYTDGCKVSASRIKFAAQSIRPAIFARLMMIDF